MKNLKRIAALLLAVALLCGLAACGGETQPEETEAETTAATEPSTTEPETTEPETTEPETTEAPTTTEAEPTENETLSGLDLGTIDGNTYTNEMLALRCELGDSWYVYSEDDLASLLGIVADSFSDTVIGDAVENSQSVTVFFAMDTTTYGNINIAVSKNSMPSLSEENFVALMVPQMKPLLEQSGFEDVTCTEAEFEFAGQNHTGVDITATVQGMTVYERQVYLMADSCMYVVTATAYEENGAQAMLDIFTALN